MNKRAISFDEVYWYLHDCPLRRLTIPVMYKPDHEAVYERYITPAVIRLYKGENSTAVQLDIVKQLNKSSLTNRDAKIIGHALAIMLTYSVVYISSMREADIIAESLKFDHDGLKGSVDLVRRKESKLYQLIWVDYRPEYPDAEERIKMFQHAQWHARLYELHYKRRPFQLTYFLPALGEHITFAYNPDAGLEVIAELIRLDVTPAKPGPRCDTCSSCAMRYIKTPVLKGGYDVRKYTWKHQTNP